MCLFEVKISQKQDFVLGYIRLCPISCGKNMTEVRNLYFFLNFAKCTLCSSA